jgi:hypothetical protein
MAEYHFSLPRNRGACKAAERDGDDVDLAAFASGRGDDYRLAPVEVRIGRVVVHFLILFTCVERWL